MYDDSTSEIAKAVQEVAKTASKGLEATEILGGALSRIANEPLKEMMGMLCDKLRFARWERKVRFILRVREVLQQLDPNDRLRILPPKLALPIVENALLEEDDELQDLWAELIGSVLDSKFDGVVRSAFVDVIKQLEVVDVHILQAMYQHVIGERVNQENSLTNPIAKYFVTPTQITSKLDIDLSVYENSVDNLLRQRLLSSNSAFQRMSASDSYAKDRGDLPNYRDYDLVCLTPFGISFVRACVRTH